VVEGLIGTLEIPLVLDADALNLLSMNPSTLDVLSEREAPTVLTPHPGEFERLTGVPAPEPGRRSDAAAELARRTGAVVVLKGHRSVVTDGHRAWVEPAGNPGMATGGMGDVLSGVVGALLAIMPSAAEATALAVHAHALAGDLAAQELGTESVLPGDVADRLGRVMRSLKDRPTGY
jgi:NAD(P)H-hydrate epimerase